MSDEPSTHGTDVTSGQDASGRFVKGNSMGVGNLQAGRAAKLRAVLFEKLTPEETESIADVLLAMARSGDLAAIKILFEYTIGKPEVIVSARVVAVHGELDPIALMAIASDTEEGKQAAMLSAQAVIKAMALAKA